MPKTKTTIKEANIILSDDTLLNMAKALNEISLDFEMLEEYLDRDDKIRILKEIRNDLTNIFWNYDLKKRNIYDKHTNNTNN